MSASGTDQINGTSAKMSRPNPGPTEWINVSVVYGPPDVEKKRTKTSPSVLMLRGSLCDGFKEPEFADAVLAHCQNFSSQEARRSRGVCVESTEWCTAGRNRRTDRFRKCKCRRRSHSAIKRSAARTPTQPNRSRPRKNCPPRE